MISVDDRTGSIELLPALRQLAPILIKPSSGVPIPSILPTRLLSSDVCFDGVGTQGKKTAVGIERKRVRDMMNSIRSGRYSGHQLPEMLDYFDHCYLIIEGYQRCSRDGELETLMTSAHPLGDSLGGKWVPVTAGNSSTFRFFELDHFIATLESCTSVHVRRTHTDHETCAEILSLYTHHQTAPEDHHAHQALHKPQNHATIGKAGLVRKVAACIEGIGWQKSANVAVKFNTVEEMINADAKGWIMPGIGKVLAQRAFDQLRGKYKPKGEEL